MFIFTQWRVELKEVHFFFPLVALCYMWYLSSLTRDQTRAPLRGAQSLNNWITREVPRNAFFQFKFYLK